MQQQKQLCFRWISFDFFFSNAGEKDIGRTFGGMAIGGREGRGLCL